MAEPQADADLPRGLSGGSDAWDDGPGGAILAADYFKAASQPLGAIYGGARGQAVVLLGTRTPQQLCLGSRPLF